LQDFPAISLCLGVPFFAFSEIKRYGFSDFAVFFRQLQEVGRGDVHYLIKIPSFSQRGLFAKLCSSVRLSYFANQRWQNV
jgi:hypothetical protein